MKKYKKEIIEIINNCDSKKDFYPGLRLCFDSINDQTKTILLGINPSNSYVKLKSVLKKAKNNKSDIPQIQAIEKHFNGSSDKENQTKYNEFLHKSENQNQVCFLQILAHKYHTHFLKQKLFAEKLGLKSKNYKFFDLFPIWEIKQSKLELKLKKHNLESDFVKAFYDFLKTNKSIDKIYFFNKGANKIFIKNLNKIGYKVDTKKQTIKLSDNMNSVISKSILSIEGRNIQIYSFGIGSYSFGGNQMDTLVEKYKL